MYKMDIDYGNCSTVYKYRTEEERQKRLENLIWVWDMEAIDDRKWKSKRNGIIVNLIN